MLINKLKVCICGHQMIKELKYGPRRLQFMISISDFQAKNTGLKKIFMLLNFYILSVFADDNIYYVASPATAVSL